MTTFPSAPSFSTRSRRMLALATLSLALFLIATDASILTIALPGIAADLRPDATQLLWIVDSYSLTVAALLITTAALGDRFGRRRMLRLGLAVFAIAVMLAATATTAPTLIVARVVLGVGAAMAMPATLSLVRTIFTDDRERAFAIGLWSAVGAAGFVLGPVLGGAILQFSTWPVAFWAQLPFVALALIATTRLPESTGSRSVSLDPFGVILSGAGLVAIVWGIKAVGEDGFVGSGGAILALGAACLAALAAQQLRHPRPMIDVRLFLSARFSAATLAVLASNVALSAPLLLLTQHLQIAQSLTPLHAGLALLPIAVAAVIAGPLTPRIVRLLGMNGAVAIAFALVAGGLHVLSTIEADSPYGVTASGMLLLGAGVSASSAAASAALLASAPEARAGNAAAVQETAYELGLTLGVSVFGSLALAAYRDGLMLPQGLPGTAVEAVRDGLPQAAAVAVQAPEILPVAIAAFETAFSQTMSVAALVCLALAVVAAIALPRDRESIAVSEH